MSLTRSHNASRHFRRVQLMMAGFGQETPDYLWCPPPRIWVSRIAMLMEEVLELAEAVGVNIETPQTAALTKAQLTITPISGFALTGPKLPSVLDAIADISVVNTGNFVVCGVPDELILEVVDHNNLTKVSNGHLNEETGKFEKAANHPPPDIAGTLRLLTAG